MLFLPLLLFLFIFAFCQDPTNSNSTNTNSTFLFERIHQENLIESLSKELQELQKKIEFISKGNNFQKISFLTESLLIVDDSNRLADERLPELKAMTGTLKELISDNLNPGSVKYIIELANIAKRLDNIIVLSDTIDGSHHGNVNNNSSITCNDLCFGGSCVNGECISEDDLKFDFWFSFTIGLIVIVLTVCCLLFWVCKGLVKYIRGVRGDKKKSTSEEYTYEMKKVQDEASFEKVEIQK